MFNLTIIITMEENLEVGFEGGVVYTNTSNYVATTLNEAVDMAVQTAEDYISNDMLVTNEVADKGECEYVARNDYTINVMWSNCIVKQI